MLDANNEKPNWKLFKKRIQAVSGYINLGDGCSCDIAFIYINTKIGRASIVIRNGADDCYNNTVYVIEDFGEKFYCCITTEKDEIYDFQTMSYQFYSFKQWKLCNIWKCTPNDLGVYGLSWAETLRAFTEVTSDLHVPFESLMWRLHDLETS
jgi:hypothetical protein